MPSGRPCQNSIEQTPAMLNISEKAMKYHFLPRKSILGLRKNSTRFKPFSVHVGAVAPPPPPPPPPTNVPTFPPPRPATPHRTRQCAPPPQGPLYNQPTAPTPPSPHP